MYESEKNTETKKTMVRYTWENFNTHWEEFES